MMTYAILVTCLIAVFLGLADKQPDKYDRRKEDDQDYDIIITRNKKRRYKG